MARTHRRSQAQRRASTRAALLDAAIAVLAEHGYSQLTVAEVCRRAGFSQGALFRHYPSRLDLIAAATDEVCERHRALIAEGMTALGQAADAAALLQAWRAAARSTEHAAWHEVMVAARTNPALLERVAPALRRFEAALLEAAGPDRRLGMILLSILHLLDSEAVTSAVYPNPELEAARDAWLGQVLEQALAEPKP